MSKQEEDVVKYLKLIFPSLKREVQLNKITGVIVHTHYRVDIWIEEIRAIVEIHGIQHHKPSGFGKNKIETHHTFIEQLNRDSKLKKICKQFEINYEQIDYTEKITMGDLYKRFAKYLDDKYIG